ncbi:choline dehydrogenase [Alternaria panax]|uniref:Choline dehydrogenase n=1 Tax=Alternaria panax TaxID=48097 RepID=A0AAD4IFD6_9PLEO|nr:choline dehydrogenase [Alternaria panax]
MRLNILLAFLAALVSTVQAQNALEALASHMPKCALACFMQELPQSTCARNLTSECLCSNDALNAAVAVCSQKTCTIYELLQTKNVSDQGCGVPVRYKGNAFLAGGYSGCILAIVAFILRMLASIGKNGRQVSWDDLTMGIVLLLAIPPAVFGHFLVENGLGRDIWTLKDYQITNLLYYYFLGEIFYVTGLGISKISILFFYLRVFPAKSFRTLTYSVMAVCGLYTVAFFVATLTQCRPISMAWNQWDGLHEGTCNDIHIQGWIAAAINIFLDAVVMALPMKHLAGLNMGLKKKLMVMAMFGVGIFVIVVSIIRLESLIHFSNTQNITWDYFDAGLWSLIEIDVSIICGCMPAHRMLIAKFWPKITSTFASSRNNSNKGTSNKGTSNSKRSKFSTNNSSTTGGQEKSVRLSIKPKSGDEGQFIPLDDMNDNSDRTRLTRAEEHLERDSGGWIIQTHEVEDWGKPATMEREHV